MDNIPSPAEPQHTYWVKPAYLWILAILIVAAVIIESASYWVSANADFICTRTVPDNGICTNGSWGPWTTVSQTNSGGVTTTTQERTYTGTRDVSSTLQYYTLGHSVCQAGYTSGRASGAYENNFNGNATTQYSACQIVETQTNSSNGSSQISSAQSDIANGNTTTTSSSTEAASLDQLNQLGAQLGAGTENTFANASALFSAKPQLVRSGNPTTVTWSATGVSSCTVSGTNGDSWTGLSSPTNGQPSSPIMGQTIFTLSCPVSDGSVLIASTTVNVIPTYQEQ